MVGPSLGIQDSAAARVPAAGATVSSTVGVAPGFVEGDIVEAATDSVPVLAAPADSAAAVATLVRGESVVAGEVRGGFVRVRVGVMTGWARVTRLRKK